MYVLQYRSETQPVKEKDVISLERNDEKMVWWMSDVRPGDKISAGKLKNRLKLNRMREYLGDRRLQWFSHLERTEENAWSSNYKLMDVLQECDLENHAWNDVIGRDLKKRDFSKGLVKTEIAIYLL